MATEDIKLKISVPGGATSAETFAQIVAEMKKAKAQQDQLAKSQRDSTKSTKENTDAFSRWKAATQQAANDNMRLAQSINATSAATVNLGANTQQLRAKLAPAAALLGNLNASVATLAPELLGASTALQRTGMAASQFLGVLGGGPGIVLGGLVAGVTMLATYMASTKKEADELAKATEANAEAMGSYLDQIQKLRSSISQANAQRKAENDLQARLTSGRGTAEEYETEVGLIQDQIRAREFNYNQQVQRIREDPRNWASRMVGAGDDAEERRRRSQIDVATKQKDREIAELRSRLEELRSGSGMASDQSHFAAQQEADRKALERELEVTGTPNDPKKADKLPPGFGSVDPETTRAQLDKLTQMIVESQTNLQMLEREGNESVFQENMERIQSEHEEKLRVIKEEREAAELSRQQEAQEHKQHMQQLAEQRKVYQNLAIAGTQMLASTAIKAAQDAAKGQKVQIGAVLEGLGDQMVGQGTFYILDGIAKSILLNPQGPALIGIGTAMTTAGIGLGAAGAHSPGGSAAGGAPAGGGGPSGPYATPYGSPQNPTTPQQPTTINITMPTVMSPSAEDGQRIVEAIRSAQRLYGTSPYGTIP